MSPKISANGYKKYSINSDTWDMLDIAHRENIETVWDRLAKQEPQCGYCNLGTSCRICAMGPCRVDPFGDGPQKGVCGADSNIIVARNLARNRQHKRAPNLVPASAARYRHWPIRLVRSLYAFGYLWVPVCKYKTASRFFSCKSTNINVIAR